MKISVKECRHKSDAFWETSMVNYCYCICLKIFAMPWCELGIVCLFAHFFYSLIHTKAGVVQPNLGSLQLLLCNWITVQLAASQGVKIAKIKTCKKFHAIRYAGFIWSLYTYLLYILWGAGWCWDVQEVG